MIVEHFHNATCIITSAGGFRVLCDPWFTDGALEGSWCLTHEPHRIPEAHTDFDGLYVSHVHTDHFDETFLANVDRAIPVVVPAEPLVPILRPKFRALGFTNVTALTDELSTVLGDLRITVFGAFQNHPFDVDADFPNIIDSAALFDDGESTFLNTNDNVPTAAQLTRLEATYGIPDVTTLLYNSAGAYPQCIDDLDHEEKLRERDVVIARGFARLLDVARASRSPLVMPFAGDYVLGGSLAVLNQYLPLSTSSEAAEHLRAHGRHAFAPGAGTVLDVGTARVLREGRYVSGAEAQRRVSDLPVVFPHERDPQVDVAKLTEMLRPAGEHLREKQERVRCFPPYRITIVDQQGTVVGTVSLAKEQADYDVIAQLDPRLLYRLLTRQAHWDNARTGCHIRFRRSNHPYYSSDMFQLLSFLHL